jgi:hypothetical protein
MMKCSWNQPEMSMKCPFFRMILQKCPWNQPEISRVFPALDSAQVGALNLQVAAAEGQPPDREASPSPSKTTTYRYSHPGVDRILSIYLSIDRSIHPSIDPSIHPSTYLSIHISISLSLTIYNYIYNIIYIYWYIYTCVWLLWNMDLFKIFQQ